MGGWVWLAAAPEAGVMTAKHILPILPSATLLAAAILSGALWSLYAGLALALLAWMSLPGDDDE